MFQIRAEQYAAMRRKKIGDALIDQVSELKIAGRWDGEKSSVLLKDAVGQQGSVGFDGLGFIGSFASPLGRTWRFANLADGKPQQIASPSGHAVNLGYNAEGLLSSLSSTTRQPVQLHYDFQRRPIGAVHADGTTEALEYTHWGAPQRMSDRLGTQTALTYDELRRLTSLTDGNGNTTRFAYSRWSRPDATLFPNGATESYSYDKDGRVAGIRQGSVTIAVKCNDKGRPLELKYNDGTVVQFEYDEKGNVTKAALGDLVTELAYNDQGQLTEDTTGNVTQTIAYDEVGRIVSIASSTGERVAYQWDADSRLAGFTDWNGGQHTIEYVSGDRGTVTTGPGGVRSFTGLNPAGKVESLNVTHQGKSLFSMSCSYDAEERLSTTRDSLFGERAFSYDAAGRVVYADANTLERRESFAYDRAGNLTSMNGVAMKVDAANQLVAFGDEELSYDTRGNLIRRCGRAGDWVYAYNAHNQMVSATSPTGVQTVFAYDAFGRRISKRTGDKETRFRWVGESLVGETTADLSTRTVSRQEFLYRPGTHTPLATRIDGEVYSYSTNQLGTPRAMSSQDGTIVWAGDSSAFGAMKIAAKGPQNPLRFPGQYFDSETGLHYNRFRYYSPQHTRYISRDPIGLLAGNNAYLYVADDPLNGTDPLGLSFFNSAISFVAGAAVGVAVGALVVAAAPAIGLVGVGVLVAEAVLAGFAAGAAGEAMNEALSGQALCLPCIAKAGLIGAAVGLAVLAGGALLGLGKFAGVKNVAKIEPSPASALEDTQIPKGFNEVYAKAPVAKAEIDALADRLAVENGGTVAKAPIKSAARSIQKINSDYGGDPTRIKDLARNTIIVDASKVNAVADQLSSQGAVVKVIDSSTNELGYSGVNATVITQDGLPAEIQVNSPEMIYAKEPEGIARSILGDEQYDQIANQTGIEGGQGHTMYEQWRNLPPTSPQAQEIATQSQNYYNAVRGTNGN